MKELFLKLFSAKTEKEISKIIYNEIDIFGNDHWKPLGGIESNYGII